ncbi:MAG: sigma-70 family RNA polymerase sigma factor [Planctomycetota bacterium]|nr:sigma-70 family RNA polymerase sigma factor [Planctomycetota bacterium]
MWPENEHTQNLLARRKDGDQTAWNVLLQRHRSAVQRLIHMRLDNRIRQRVGVSDVVQDVMIAANRRIDRYLQNPGIDFHLWLRQIAKDRIIDAHRRHRTAAKRSVDREHRLVQEGGAKHSTMNLAGQIRDADLTPAARATRREMANRMEDALLELNELDRDIIIMRHYEQLSNDEVSQALNLQPAAASMRYLRALRKLKNQLLPQQDDSQPNL